MDEPTVAATGNQTAAPGDQTLPYQGFPEYQTAMKVRIVALSIIIPLATVGNILSVVVLCRKSLRRSTTSLYLIFLSCVDFAVIYSVCLPESISKLTGHFLENTSDAWCRFSFFNSHFTRQLSSWVLVLVSIERVIAIFFPLKAKKLCSRRAGAVALLLTTVCLVVLSSRLFFTRNLTEQMQCKAPKDLVYFATKISPWIIKVVYWLAPAVIMLFTNSLILIKLRLIAKRSSDRAAGKMTNNTIIILVATTTFIITTTPIVLFFIVNPGWNIQAAEIKVKYELRYALLQSLAYLNHAVNFLMYVTTAPIFRRELKIMITGKCKQHRVTPVTSTTSAVRSHMPAPSVNCFETQEFHVVAVGSKDGGNGSAIAAGTLRQTQVNPSANGMQHGRRNGRKPNTEKRQLTHSRMLPNIPDVEV